MPFEHFPAQSAISGILPLDQSLRLKFGLRPNSNTYQSNSSDFDETVLLCGEHLTGGHSGISRAPFSLAWRSICKMVFYLILVILLRLDSWLGLNTATFESVCSKLLSQPFGPTRKESSIRHLGREWGARGLALSILLHAFQSTGSSYR